MLPNIRSMLLFWRFCPMNAPRHLGNRVRVLSQAIRQAIDRKLTDLDTNTLKPATVESGATVRVPLFINEGETIEIDTRDGSYVGRVKA